MASMTPVREERGSGFGAGERLVRCRLTLSSFEGPERFPVEGADRLDAEGDGCVLVEGKAMLSLAGCPCGLGDDGSTGVGDCL